MFILRNTCTHAYLMFAERKEQWSGLCAVGGLCTVCGLPHSQHRNVTVVIQMYIQVTEICRALNFVSAT